MNQGQKQLRAARASLSDDRLIAFLKTANGDSKKIFALKLICEDLDAGFNLDDIFAKEGEAGYLVKIKRLCDSRFFIEFGYVAGHLCGDGGQWEVSFEGNSVATLEHKGWWIS